MEKISQYIKKSSAQSVADAFTRALLGNTQTGLRQLQSALPLKLDIPKDSDEYNRVYKKTYQAIEKIIRGLE